MYALTATLITLIHCGNYATATMQFEELVALTDEKSSSFWKALGTMMQGCVLAMTGKASDAIHVITSGATALRSTGSTMWLPLCLSYLARAHAELGQFNDAWRCMGEATTAMETTKEKWLEAEVNRIAGEIALKSPEPDVAKTEAYFKRALAGSRQQQAKSWELRAAMSMARLWRDQGKVREACELLDHSVVLRHGGKANCVALSFQIPPDADLDAFERQVAAQGVKTERKKDPEPSVTDAVTFADPKGTIMSAC